MIWAKLKHLLFFFDPENAHRFIVFLIRATPAFLLRWISGVSSPSAAHSARHSVMGLSFPSRVGLAAGFDKNGEIFPKTMDLGFGFIEIGTLTPLPQSGNEKPRLFRIEKKESLFNRMGFNNEGADRVCEKLKQYRQKTHTRDLFPIGVNIGKNKNTSDEDAKKDYLTVLRKFLGLADYFVINVSSPNTPGLRALQEIEFLSEISHEMLNEINNYSQNSQKKPAPLLIKLSPEFFFPEYKDEASLKKFFDYFEQTMLSGWILTNTLQLNSLSEPLQKEVSGLLNQDISTLGGLSGKLVQDVSKQALVKARKFTKKTIISVGGIDSAQELAERFHLGADLVQIYSGWIFKGPKLPQALLKN